MKHSNIIQLTAFLLLSILFSGCLKSHDDTIVLPTFTGEISDAVIPTEIRDQFENYMNIYEGQNPPDISGEYLCKPLMIVYTSDGQFDYGDLFADMYFAFEKNNSSEILQYRGKQGGSTTIANNVMVVGEGNNFTAYFISDSENLEDGTTYRKATLISGTVTNSGITNFQYAFIMLDKYDPEHTLMDVNEYRIFKDQDGLATRYYWTSKQGTEKNSTEATLPNATSKNKSSK